MLKTKELHQLTVNRTKELTIENKEYYMSMSSYIRTSNVSPKESEELLLEILDHLLLAQKEGKSAEDVFGKQPQLYCDELIENTSPFPFIKKLIFYSSLWILSFCLILFTTLTEHPQHVFLVDALESFLLFIGFLFIQWWIHKISFMWKANTRLLFTLCIGTIGLACLWLTFQHLQHSSIQVVLFVFPVWIKLVFSFTCLITGIVLYKGLMTGWKR